MNDKQLAAAELARFAMMLRGVMAIGPDLEKLGSFEQAEAEVRSRVDKLQADEAAAKARVDGFDQAYEKKRLAAKDASDQLIAAAEQSKADAVAAGKRIVAEAQARADGITSAARTEADKVRDDTANASAALDQINSEIAAKSKQLDQIKTELAAVLKRIDV